ncbi:MAG: PP2C family serine/threonine-protein phosphatase [Byssovorax sp.]
MPWTLAAAAFLFAYVTLVVVFRLRPVDATAKGAPPSPAPTRSERAAVTTTTARRTRPMQTGRETPISKRSGAGAAPGDIPLLSGDDEDDDITIVTLGPLVGGAMPTLPMSAFEDDDDFPQPGPEAVPIVYDQDAAEDEPTRIEALILVSAAGHTDTGQRRKKNEDSYVILDDHNLFVVADGMGGHAGGEIASKIAVDTIAAAFKANTFAGERYANVPRRGSELALAVQMANEAIFARAKVEADLEGMGTTVVAARFSPNKQRLYIGHVGDSRCYRLRDGELRQVTTDHTMGASGITGPLADRLERAVGIAPAVKVDVIIARPLPNDLYLLCSDGLSKMVELERMREILVADKNNLDKSASDLVAEANAVGGRDNITVILVQVKSPATLFA